MARTRGILLALLVIWAILFVLSYVMSVRIEGPRNIDTGFQRLDMLVKWQLSAFGVALVSAVMGIVWRKTGKRMLLMGLAPLLATAAVVLVLVIVGTVIAARQRPEPTPAMPPKLTAPAMEDPAPAGD